MRLRSLLAAMVIAFAAATASAALGDIEPPRESSNFPRPMPGRVIQVNQEDGWLQLKNWLGPLIGPERLTPVVIR